MAFACRPHVIVCDEPTTGLDVTTQAKVLETVRDLCRTHRVAALYVSHDLAVVAELADRVAVMYAGRIVESAPRDALFSAPRHPYTKRLLRAVPDLAGDRIVLGIPGRAPLPSARPTGCFFAPRCAFARDDCRAAFPPITDLGAGHAVRCYHVADAQAAREETGAKAEAPAALGRDGAGRQLAERHVRWPPDAVRHQSRRASRRVPGAGRRVGLGQDDACPLCRRSAQGLHRRGEAARRLTAPLGAQALGAGAPADSIRVPEPVRLAQPEADGRPDDRAPAAAVLPARPTQDRGARRRMPRARVALGRGGQPISRSAVWRRASARRDRSRAGGRACAAGV